MTKSFDDILEEGKNRAAGKKSPRSEWKSRVYGLMRDLLDLNSLYNNDKHNIKVERGMCDKCLKVSYVVIVRNIIDENRSIRFHQSGWKHLGKNVYICDECVV